MFNKKSFLIILLFLFLVSFFNLFNQVTLEYVGISLNVYKEFEISCGTVIEIFSNIDNEEFMQSLGMDRTECIGTAVVKLINFISSIIFLIVITFIGLAYFKRIDTKEDLSDLIMLLKRRNSK